MRWWRFSAGILLGLACATKWSGLYFVVFFGAMSLAFDVAARRQYQVPRPWLGALRRDLFPTGYALALIPFAVYLASYAPWFASETAIDRHEVGQTIGPTSDCPAARRDSLALVLHGQGVPIPRRPDEFRGQLPPVGIQTVELADVVAAGALRHRPAERSRLRRPVLRQGGDAGRHARHVVAGGAGVAIRVAGARPFGGTGAMRLLLVGYCAGWLPWFADIDRQMYFFYAATMAPFLVMAIALILGDILYPRRPVGQAPGAERRTTHAGADRRLVLCGVGGDELRLAVSGAHRSAHLTTDLEHGDLAAQLALFPARAEQY